LQLWYYGKFQFGRSHELQKRSVIENSIKGKIVNNDDILEQVRSLREEMKQLKYLLLGEKEDTDFDIESLDPDKRSWYYDDTGVKRKKDER